jgi:hypothetical protein
MNLTNLNRIISKIIYQIGKLEVIESMYLDGKNFEPSLEMEMAYNMIATLRQKLLIDSEVCFDLPLDTLKPSVISLQKTLVSVNNFLIQMSSGLISTERNILFLKELFTTIVSELSILNTELNVILQSASVTTILDSPLSEIDQLLKNLKSKCLGDTEKVERLIQYEYKKSPQSSRQMLVESAIMRWESDNR